MTRARLTHGFVFVSDLEAAIAFYEGALGFSVRRSSDSGYVMMVASEGASIALHLSPERLRKPVPVPAPRRHGAAYKLCFETDDLPELRRAIQAHGGQVEEPWSWEGTTFCEATDTEGNCIQLFVEESESS